MKKKVSILGSTGSIGLNCLKIIKNYNFFKINILIANKNYRLICKQINDYNPKIFIIYDKKTFYKVKKKYKKKKIKIYNSLDSKDFILTKSDITIAAIPGIAGLKPTIEFTKTSKKILIANKESIICGWNLIKNTAFRNNTKIIPVDSEHFSIMKLLENHNINEVRKVYLTASGGPFFNVPLAKLDKVQPQEALKHPKWKMGKKISIDSATMMNKILEVIEAQKIFSLNEKIIEIVIHPQSLVHAIVEFKNGLYKFLYHDTTMIIPLANAILGKNFDIKNIYKPKMTMNKNLSLKKLNFYKVETKRYPIIKLKSRLNEYNSTSIIVNAVNEILVDQYLQKKIDFTSFYNYFLKVLNDRNYKKYAIKIPKNISQILEIDQWSKKVIGKHLKLKRYV